MGHNFSEILGRDSDQLGPTRSRKKIGSGQDEPKFSNFGPESGRRKVISWSDRDLIGPKMNIQDAIKIKLLRWENEFERVEHF